MERPKKRTRLSGQDSTSSKRTLQVTSCNSLGPKFPYSRCFSCSNKEEEKCRFKGIRIIVRKGREYSGIEFRSTSKYGDKSSQKPDLPKTWRAPLSSATIQDMKRSIAQYLLPMFTEEYLHIKNGAAFRSYGSDAHFYCEICSVLIFTRAWLCDSCGVEICSECFEKGIYNKINPENEKLVRCSTHNFRQTSRFMETTLDAVIPQMRHAVASQPSCTPGASEEEPVRLKNFYQSLAHLIGDSPDSILPEVFNTRIHRFGKAALPQAIFESLWRKGEPILVEGCSESLREDWSPTGFRKRHGPVKLEIIDSQSLEQRECPVEEFLEDYGHYIGRSVNESWQVNLDSYELNEDFAFSSHFADFCSALPLPMILCPDGPLNLIGHFPSDLVPPDFGPLMQFAKASNELPGTQGTMRLSWLGSDTDIFRREDSAKLRAFLLHIEAASGDPNLKVPEEDGLYLDKKLRDRLWKEYRVESYRVHQKQGEVIIIPADCAYQICNLSDCINVQMDFISVHSLQQCEKRGDKVRYRKDTAANLHFHWILWYAWLSCEAEERRQKNVPGIQSG
ncbi:hypothetical protein D9757_011105 [Collybiopsis confluens]|uniref:JmjC domain-containing protein n=1 Tax=Collybiopsis confluens TaxID=2823264 RepID=A0A8H5GX24_9AGAR|nr:hypothetical protein D9757_011105 [Collybiopsis confluens]